MLNLPPTVQWDICIAFTFVEMCVSSKHDYWSLLIYPSVSFMVSTILVFVEDHTGKSGGGPMTSAQYV